jgi:hypothetical protein
VQSDDLLDKVERNFERLEKKMLVSFEENLDRILETVGKKIDKTEERLEAKINKSEEKMDTGFQDVTKSLEESQKKEFTSQREQVQSDMRTLQQLLSDILYQRTDRKVSQGSIYHKQAPTFACLPDVSNSRPSTPGRANMHGNSTPGSMTPLNADLQVKLAGMEERQSKNQVQLEENMCRKLQHFLNSAMQTFSNMAAHQMQTSIDKLTVTIEASCQAQGKLEHRISHITRETAEESSKNISMGIGVVGNSLRLQLENMQATQKGTLTSVMEEMQHHIQQLSQKDVEKMKRIEACLEECVNRALMHASDRQLEDLREFQRRMEGAMQEQAEHAKKTHTALTSALRHEDAGSSDERLCRDSSGKLKWGSRERGF